MDYTIKAIPTVYKGRQYRSRLEARWAAMFDLLGWQVEYEPCDFDGWIPDFVIIGNKPIYAEVKPVTELPEETCAELERSGCVSEMLILGSAIAFGHSGLRLGWLWDKNWWEEAVLGTWKGEDGKGNQNRIVGFCHSVNGFGDRITGLYDGGSYGSGPDPTLQVQSYWHQAGNLVQWNAPKGGR